MDITGNRFNKLTVIRRVQATADSGKGVHWLCHCDCGNEIVVKASSLLEGNLKSCGCESSSGEIEISQFLKNNNIAFIREKTFPDCKDKKLLRFDFYLPDYNTIIEFHGCQHFFPVAFFGGEEAYRVRKVHDQIKREYCSSNNLR